MLESIIARTAPLPRASSSPHESKQLLRGHFSTSSIASRISYRVLTVTDIGAVCPVTVPSVGPRTRVSWVVDANVNEEDEVSAPANGNAQSPGALRYGTRSISLAPSRVGTSPSARSDHVTITDSARLARLEATSASKRIRSAGRELARVDSRPRRPGLEPACGARLPWRPIRMGGLLPLPVSGTGRGLSASRPGTSGASASHAPAPAWPGLLVSRTASPLSAQDVLDRGVLQGQLGLRFSFAFSAASSFKRFRSSTEAPAYFARY